MGATQAIPPPPGSPDDVTPDLGPASKGSGSKMDLFRGIVNHLSGGGTPAIQERLDADFAKRKHDAELYRTNAKQFAGYLTHANATKTAQAPFGINPVTGQPATDADIQQWHNNLDTMQQSYQKLLPKDAKPIAQKLGEVLEHAIGRKGQTGAPAGQNAAPAPAITPPPQQAQGQAQPGDTGGEAGPAIPPPPTGAGAPTPTAAPQSQNAMEMPASMSMQALGGPELQRMTGVQNALATSKAAGEQESDIAVSTEHKKRMAAAQDASDELDKVAPNMPPEQKSALLQRKLGYVPPPKMVTKIMSDPQSPTGASQVSYDQLTGQVYSRQQGAFMPRGYLATETLTTDPYGNVTVSQRMPVTPGVGGQGPAKGAGGAGKPAAPTGSGAGAGSGGSKGAGSAKPSAVPPPLDGEGHIASGPIAGYTPQAVEGANQLLDGQDVLKLPAASRALSSQLARKYGWEQGKFTPKEQTQIREASTFIADAMKDETALAALDGDTMDRALLSQVLANPDKEGFIGRTMTGMAAQNMDDKQTAFVQMYNQLVGTIAGLSKLVRPGGTTEAQIERLKSELPNPVNTKNSADARARLARLQKEIDVAVAKGTFGDASMNARATTPRPANRPGAIAPPPTGVKKQFYRLGGKAYDAQTHQEIPAAAPTQ